MYNCIVSGSLLEFFILFEAILIPTLILVLGWGYQPERVQARVYLLFYTLLGSLPLLLNICWVGNTGLYLIDSIWGKSSIGLYFIFISGFLIKLPIYGLHLWLPKAHVEASVTGSILLAGLLLKLGGVGLLYIATFILKGEFETSQLLIRFSVIGGCWRGVVCICQIDIKSLVAYSSVSHISIVVINFIILSNLRLNSVICIILGHGLCARGLFFLVNVLFKRTNSRNLLVVCGSIFFIPIISLLWFLIVVANIAAPPTLNLLNEIFLIIRALNWDKYLFYGLFFIVFIRGVYRLYLYRASQSDFLFNRSISQNRGVITEFLVLILHIIPLYIIRTKWFFYLD